MKEANFKKFEAGSIAALLVVIALFTMVPTAVAHTQSSPFVTDLIAGGGNENSEIIAGDVLIWNDADYIYVKYVTDAPWLITETHLAIGDNFCDDIPQTKKGNPIPGQFEYSNYHDYVSEFLYTIPNTWPTGTSLYIAAHAVVKKPIEGCYQTVWQIGDVETVDPLTNQLTCYYNEFNWDGPVIVIWPPFANPFIVGTTPTNQFPWNSNKAFNYAHDFNINWNGGLPFGGKLTLSWSPGKSGTETKIITDIDNSESATFIETGGSSSTGWQSYKLVQSVMTPSALDSGSHVFRFQHTTGDGTLWDWVRLEKPCEHEETAWGDGTDFPGKNWATYIIYGVEWPERWPETGMAYIGYDDQHEGGDFDYNDFGMDMSVTEMYSPLGLEDIQMTFIGRLKLASYTHRIYLYWSDTVSGHVHVEYYNQFSVLLGTSDADFTGSVDVEIFDNTANAQLGYTTLVHITFNSPTTSSMAPPYDPYIYVTNTGHTYHIDYTKTASMPAGSHAVPYILVVPKTWTPPVEGQNIWNLYTYFDEYYVNGGFYIGSVWHTDWYNY
jgi:hypothetical protein